MSVYALSVVFKAKMTPSEKVLMLALADYADDEGGSIYPSQATMAEKSSLGERTVTRLLSAFRDRGWLTEEESATQHRPARYRMHLEVVRKLRVATLATLSGSPTSAARVANDDIQGSHGGYQSVSKKHPSVEATKAADAAIHPTQTPRSSPEKTRTPQPPKTPAAGCQAVIAGYCDRWKAMYGATPVMGPREAGQIAAIVKARGAEEAGKLVAAYFDSDDRFVRDARHSVGVFRAVLPRLVADVSGNGVAVADAHPDSFGWADERRAKLIPRGGTT